MKRIIYTLALALALCNGVLYAQEVKEDSVRIHFRQGYSVLDLDKFGNAEALDSITYRLKEINSNPKYKLLDVAIEGGASPEGSVRINKGLSERRADVLYKYLFGRAVLLPDTMGKVIFRGRDWGGLIRLAQDDPNLPHREETLDLLREIHRGATIKPDEEQLRTIRRFKGGVPYQYMYRRFFPELRGSQIRVTYAEEMLAPAPEPEGATPLVVAPQPCVPDTIVCRDTIYITETRACLPVFAALKTNLLYDAALVPNIGAEIYLGKNWSLSANAMYAWWSNDSKHYYWRIRGGEVEARWWFGKSARRKPLTGHHLGLYGQMVTYDIELGGKGYLGERWTYGAGLSYGYSLPIAKRLNLDFGIGLGYLGGKYMEYTPYKDCYMWEATKQRHWFGPTRAEISLVWLIGCDNVNVRR